MSYYTFGAYNHLRTAVLTRLQQLGYGSVLAQPADQACEHPLEADAPDTGLMQQQQPAGEAVMGSVSGSYVTLPLSGDLPAFETGPDDVNDGPNSSLPNMYDASAPVLAQGFAFQVRIVNFYLISSSFWVVIKNDKVSRIL